VISTEERREREEAAANAIGSARLEGLDPGRAESLLRRWAAGQLSDEQLDEAYERICAGKSIDAFLSDAIDRPA
jgi:hypothetical protein